MIDFVATRARVGAVTKLAGMRAQAPAQSALLRSHMAVRLVVLYGKRLERNACTGLGDITSLDNRSLELPAETLLIVSPSHPLRHHDGALLELLEQFLFGLRNPVLDLFWRSQRRAIQLDVMDLRLDQFIGLNSCVR